MSTMIWAAYERVSTEEQAEEGHSIQVPAIIDKTLYEQAQRAWRPARLGRSRPEAQGLAQSG